MKIDGWIIQSKDARDKNAVWMNITYRPQPHDLARSGMYETIRQNYTNEIDYRLVLATLIIEDQP